MLRHQGMRVAFQPDRVVVELPEVRPEHLGGLGTSAVNGMVLAGLFDLAVGSTVVLVDPRRRSATVQLSMSFERAVFGARRGARPGSTAPGSGRSSPARTSSTSRGRSAPGARRWSP